MPTKSLPTFDEVISRIDIKELEKERKRAHNANNKSIKNIGFAILIGGGISTLLFLVNTVLGGIAIVASVGVIIYYVTKFDLSNRENVEQSLIQAILNGFSDDFEYFPVSHISESVVRKSGVLGMRMGDVMDGADLVRGYYNDEYVSACHIKVTRSQGENNHRYLIFDGTYVIFKFNKDFKGRTTVLRDFLEKSLGSVGQFLQNTLSWGKLVKLEDADFEDKFVVYSDDQVEARYLLSPSFMQKLMELDEQSFKGVTCAFMDGNIHIALNGSGELFDVSLSDGITKDAIYPHYETVYQLLKIREFLGLDEKLWSKK